MRAKYCTIIEKKVIHVKGNFEFEKSELIFEMCVCVCDVLACKMC